MPQTLEQRADEIMERLWAKKGVLKDALDQDRRLADIFNALLRQGRRAEEIRAEWETLTSEEILKKYDDPLPVPDGTL